MLLGLRQFRQFGGDLQIARALSCTTSSRAPQPQMAQSSVRTEQSKKWYTDRGTFDKTFDAHPSVQIRMCLQDAPSTKFDYDLVARVSNAYNTGFHTAIHTTPKEALRIGRSVLHAEAGSSDEATAMAAWEKIQQNLKKAQNRIRGGKEDAVATTSAFQIGDLIRMPKLGTSSSSKNAVRGSLSLSHTAKTCQGRVLQLRDHEVEVQWITEGPMSELPTHTSWVTMKATIVKDTGLLPPVAAS